MTFDGRLKPTALSLDEVLRGPYEALDPGDLRALFRDPYAAIYDHDGHADDTPPLAEELDPVPGFVRAHPLPDGRQSERPDRRGLLPGQCPGGDDGPAAWVLTATVRGTGPNPAAPRVEVIDAFLNPVPAEVLANGNGTFTVQAVGLRPDGDYYLRVFGAGTGNYELDAGFGKTPVDIGDVRGRHPGRPDRGPPVRALRRPAAALRDQPVGDRGRRVVGDADHHRRGRAGGLLPDRGRRGDDSAVSVLLPPGEYTVRVTAGPGSVGPVGYCVRGLGLSDPIGPVLDSATLQPQYRNPSDPTTYLYPTGTVTIDPYLWVLAFTF